MNFSWIYWQQYPLNTITYSWLLFAWVMHWLLQFSLRVKQSQRLFLVLWSGAMCITSVAYSVKTSVREGPALFQCQRLPSSRQLAPWHLLGTGNVTYNFIFVLDSWYCWFWNQFLKIYVEHCDSLFSSTISLHLKYNLTYVSACVYMFLQV